MNMPGKMETGLPVFDRPPVIETILGVHFKPIRNLTTAHLGLFWQSLGQVEWPEVRELAAISTQIERFDVSPTAPLKFTLTEMTEPEVRLRLNNPDESQVIQVQPNLLQTHWVRKQDASYPRYSQSTKPSFLAIWKKFYEFLVGNGFSAPRPSQWEVTYINRVPAGNGELWQSPLDWPSIFKGMIVAPSLEDGAIESAFATYHYRLKDDSGRLHVQVRHLMGSNTRPESLNVNLTARGPLQVVDGSSDESIMPIMQRQIERGLDVGRHAIVKGFVGILSKKALDFWGFREEKADA